MKTTQIYRNTVENGGTNKAAKHKEALVKKTEEITESAEVISAKIQHRIKQAYHKLEKIDFNN